MTEVNDEDRARADEAIAQLKRDIAKHKDKPLPADYQRDKFVGQIGLDEQGNPQPPLTPEEIAHKEEIKRRANTDD